VFHSEEIIFGSRPFEDQEDNMLYWIRLGYMCDVSDAPFEPQSEYTSWEGYQGWFPLVGGEERDTCDKLRGGSGLDQTALINIYFTVLLRSNARAFS
jgi:hypothetical protein